MAGLIDFLNNFLSEIICSIVSVIGISLLNYFYGVNPRIIKFIHKYIKNSKSPMIINVTYETNVNFAELKEEIKRYFREEYGKLTLFKSSKSLKIQLNETFTLSVFDNGDDKISIITSKLPTTLKDVKKETNRFLRVLNKIKKKYESKLKDGHKFFNEKEFSIKLYLPYKGRYVKIYSPKKMKIKTYDIIFNDDEYESIVQLKGDVMNKTDERNK